MFGIRFSSILQERGVEGNQCRGDVKISGWPLFYKSLRSGDVFLPPARWPGQQIVEYEGIKHYGIPIFERILILRDFICGREFAAVGSVNRGNA